MRPRAQRTQRIPWTEAGHGDTEDGDGSRRLPTDVNAGAGQIDDHRSMTVLSAWLVRAACERDVVQSDQAVVKGEACGCRAGVDTELAVDRLEMRMDGTSTNDQPRSNVVVRQTLRH